MTETKDDKVMRSFDTGATRDTAEGKLDYDGFLSPVVLKQFARYMNMNRLQSDGQLRDSDNWQKGIPMDAYRKSYHRHHMEFWPMARNVKYQDRDGQVALMASACGMLFNVMGYMTEWLKTHKEIRFDDDEPTHEMRGRQDALARKNQTPLIPDMNETPGPDDVIEVDDVEVPGFEAIGPEEVEPGHTGFCMSEYEAGVCHDCPTEKECLNMAAREDAEARFEKSRQDFFDATMHVVQPIITAMQEWTALETAEDDLVDVPEVPVCFGKCTDAPICGLCEDKAECDTVDCNECDFGTECQEDFTAVDEVEETEPGIGRCSDCVHLEKKWDKYPCKLCSVNTVVTKLVGQYSYFRPRT